MPKAAVNQTEFAALSIRRPYQPSISDVARGENTLAAEFTFIASAGFGVSSASSFRAVSRSGSVFNNSQRAKYCWAVSASAMRCPTLVCPRKPEAVKLVEPVQTSTGSVAPFSRTINWLRLIDVGETSFEQAARQPGDCRICRVIYVLRWFVAELL